MRGPPGPGGGERVVQSVGEREVAEVVGGELQFPALGCALLGGSHDAGVVDEQVRRLVPRLDECRNGLLVARPSRATETSLGEAIARA